MFSIDKSFECCYGHRVWSQTLKPKFSLDSLCKCRHLHGHQMLLKIGLTCDELKSGMVTDFKHLNCIKKIVDDVIDHHFIMDINDPVLYELFPVLKSKEIKLKDYNYYKIIEKIPDGTSKPLSEVLEGLVLVDFVPTSENLCKFFYKVASNELKELLDSEGVRISYVDFWETPKSHCHYEP